MSCSTPPKLLTFYSNKVNIYDSNCFIPLPNWKSCPAPPCIYLAPNLVFPPAGPYVQPAVCPIPQPVNGPGAYCGKIIAPNNSSCGPCGSAPQPTGCTSCSSCG